MIYLSESSLKVGLLFLSFVGCRLTMLVVSWLPRTIDVDFKAESARNKLLHWRDIWRFEKCERRHTSSFANSIRPNHKILTKRPVNVSSLTVLSVPTNVNDAI